MGFMDGFKGEVQQQFIARPDSSKDLVVYKWPETNIRMLSLLTVQPDEWAYFVNKGEIVGYLPGGQHKLDGAQIPFLGGLIDSFTGGNALMAELYFVSSREFANNKFGGSMGEVEDPGTGEVVRCGVFGEFVYKVVDPAKLILNLIGTQPIYGNEFIVDAIKDQLTKILRAVVFSKMKAEKWSLLDVTDGTYTLEFEKTIVMTAVEYLANFGLQITRIEDFLVNMDEADRVRLLEIKDRMAKMRLAGDPRYMAAAQTEAMFGAAEGLKQGGDGSSMAGLFVGAGIGQNIAGGIQSGQVQQAATEAGAAAAAAAAPAPAAPATVPCPKCAAPVAPDAKFCPQCGTTLQKSCAKCAAPLAPDAKFCPQCGTPSE
ncbi:MAG: SPFH domain-containing protein [Coriobacteriia bacterium]|nr:SPFH domain-containing protein [Coriobacteriia bacterium]